MRNASWYLPLLNRFIDWRDRRYFAKQAPPSPKGLPPAKGKRVPPLLSRQVTFEGRPRDSW